MTAQPKWTSDCVQMKEIPEYVSSAGVPDFSRWCDDHRDEIKWSGEEPPPSIGTEILVETNHLGPGKVAGYFTEYGWLGLEVELHSPPNWWVSQAKRHGFKTAFIYGIDYRRL